MQRTLANGSGLGLDRGLFGRVAQVVVDEGEEQFQVQRFGEVFVRTGVSEPTNLAGRGVGRKDDNRDVGGPRVVAKSFQDVEAVDVGQVHVQEYEIRVTNLGDADARISLDGCKKLNIGPLK